ncbi:efflux transporter outer membrane subunit [Glaciecola sp. 1036]|uniref:efflux transporter outer membrane subunit n=1 Tax=Alteromonadaceae TaxID=72275 RepID=UPI003D07325B
MNQNYADFARYLLLSAVVSIWGCANTNEITPISKQIDIAPNWQSETNQNSVEQGWISTLNNQELITFVDLALVQNQELQQMYYSVQQSQHDLAIAEAENWPSINLANSIGRQKNNQPVNYSNSASIGFNFNYELDVFGKLSATQRQAQYLYLAQQFEYQQAKEQLVADVILAYYNVIRQQQLLQLRQQQLDNAKTDLDIIERGYKQGINESLDVYLTRNALATVEASLMEQNSTLVLAIRSLERLVGKYPAGMLTVSDRFPEISQQISTGVPSELISRKPGIQSAWYSLMSQNEALGIAHKNRYPSLSFSASLGDSADSYSNLLSSSELAWSLLGNLTVPIFQGGLLKAQEEKARLALKQSEEIYIATLLDAFADVENTLTQENNLQIQYAKTFSASEYAQRAQDIAFQQYQRGLVTYTTVLDAQDRAYSAQINLINLAYQRLENQILLRLALGGSLTNINNDLSSS